MDVEPRWMSIEAKPMAGKSRIKPVPEVGKVYQYKGEKVKVIEMFMVANVDNLPSLPCMVRYKTGKLKGQEVEALVADLYFVGDKEDDA